MNDRTSRFCCLALLACWIVACRARSSRSGVIPGYCDKSAVGEHFLTCVRTGVYWFWQKIHSDLALRNKAQELKRHTTGSPNQAAALDVGIRPLYQIEGFLP